jgi:hypothetical protein
MPKPNSPIPDEIVLRDFDILSGYLRLTPQQVSMIMGISLKKVEANRIYGNPPPFVKQGGKVLYRIEDVRNYLKSQPVYKSSAESIAAQKKVYERQILGIRGK